MDDEKSRIVRERMDEARETLLEAETLLAQDLRRGVINRSYYAMFYAVLALASSKGQVISKHTHAIAFFDKEFVRKGIFPKEISRSLHFGFEDRQTRDYGEIWEIDRADVEATFQDAKNFVEAIENYLKHL
ncbi:MAG: HEPN domain-containing protein [Chloroflexi bacterium]|nr:HEPN domain-containing protein [Chloroflexota bacterium]